MSELSKKALLVALQISTWSARRYDDKASAAVSEHFNSKKDAGRYNKCLIDIKHPSFKALNQLATTIREWHYSHTLPWAQNGLQLLPTKEYFEYANQMRKFSEKFEEAVQEFLADFPALKEAARIALNGLYREEDYPTEQELADKYRFGATYLPMPDAQDFRVEIGNAEQRKLRDALSQELEATMHDAMADLWTRLYEPVQHMAAALASPEKKFHDSLVGNIQEIVEVLPRLNMTDDPHLTKLTKQVRDSLTCHHPQTLRDVPDVRTETAKKAAEIAARIKSLGLFQ